ncbi:hypothetical protein RvY_03899 [Ramazzottius varieornatus]|uniref:Uncharacterized protein n=1 Tax=Ramazzottius varieornatus TaxID=947166 RepID=A0A1D1UT57_RAMVA|nr:hypothetical protein RvY_03899 [Ramazzottius varieornatus]
MPDKVTTKVEQKTEIRDGKVVSHDAKSEIKGPNEHTKEHHQLDKDGKETHTVSSEKKR